MKENTDFALIPKTDPEGGKGHWQVKILKGRFVDCVIKFGEVRPDPTTESNKWDFTVTHAIDPDTDVITNPKLIETARQILDSILDDTMEHRQYNEWKKGRESQLNE